MITNSKEYHAKYMKVWRAANKDKVLNSTRNWRKNPENRRKAYDKQNKNKLDNKIKAIAYLGGKCCKCDREYPPVCYDFHHINRAEKEYSLSVLLHLRWEKIVEELKKCVLLCSNCHRLEHYEHKE